MKCPCCGFTFDDRISPEIRKEALRLYGEGFSLRKISGLLDNKISYSSVSRLVQGFVKDNLRKQIKETP